MLEIKSVDEVGTDKIDAFIMDENTNGEFINTNKYLSYHKDRFVEDSIAVLEQESQSVCGVMMATVGTDNYTVTSHAGTTFAGIVISGKIQITQAEKILDIMISYYEEKYKKIELKLTPFCYTSQPNHMIDYFLLKRGFCYGLTALVNMINISSVCTMEDVLTLCHSRRRGQIRKALREDQFQMKEKGLDETVWRNMNQNLQQKYQSHTTHTFDEINELANKFPDQIRAFYMETREGEYGAFALVYCFKNVFHTQYLDLNYNFSKQNPNLILILKLILKARELGYSYFSFGASTEDSGNILNYSLYRYKAEFGGGSILLPLYTKNIKEEVPNKKTD